MHGNALRIASRLPGAPIQDCHGTRNTAEKCHEERKGARHPVKRRADEPTCETSLRQYTYSVRLLSVCVSDRARCCSALLRSIFLNGIYSGGA